MYKVQTLLREFRRWKWPEKSLAAAGLELTTMVLSDFSVLCCSCWSSALVKLLSGRSTLRRSPFFMAGSRTQPLKGIAIQTTPAPLLGLQHVPTVPGSQRVPYHLPLGLRKCKARGKNLIFLRNQAKVKKLWLNADIDEYITEEKMLFKNPWDSKKHRSIAICLSINYKKNLGGLQEKNFVWKEIGFFRQIKLISPRASLEQIFIIIHTVLALFYTKIKQ